MVYKIRILEKEQVIRRARGLALIRNNGRFLLSERGDAKGERRERKGTREAVFAGVLEG